MSKEKMVYFRTSIGGFNKEDVNSYIEKLNADFADREKAAKRKLDAAEGKCAELDSAKSQLEAALSKISEMESDAAKRETLITEQIGQIEAQAAEIDTLKLSKNDAESEVAQLTEQIESLSEAIRKSEKYDDVSAQIGEIILSAKSTAEDILAKADKEAEERRKAANEQLENAAAGFNARAATATYAIKNQMKKIARESYSAIAAKTEQTAAMLHSLAENITDTSSLLDSQLASGKSEAENAIESEAAKVFSEENRIKLS